MKKQAADYYRIVDSRSSCRSFSRETIPEDMLGRILDAGCKAPSKGGFQCLSIVSVTDPEMRKELMRCSRGQKFVADAPVSLVFCCDYHRMSRIMDIEPAPFRETDSLKDFIMSVVDAAVCAQTVALAAEAEGLGSCYNGNILNRMEHVGNMLQLPKHVFPVIMLTIGRPKIRNRQAPKYLSSLLVHNNVYQDRSAEDLYRAYRKQNRWRKFPARSGMVDACCKMAEQLHGREKAEQIRGFIEKRGWMGPYQFWFGCYYRDEPDFMNEADYCDYFSKQGFKWFNNIKGE